MDRKTVYLVLRECPSSSSDAIHQVRRGGDGVLYCTCKGWAFNKDHPKRCAHTDLHVAATGAPYYLGRPDLKPQAPTPSASVSVKRSSSGKRPRADVAAPIQTIPAPADWRERLLKEQTAAAKATPPAAMAAFARLLDLGADVSSISATVGASVVHRKIDL